MNPRRTVCNKRSLIINVWYLGRGEIDMTPEFCVQYKNLASVGIDLQSLPKVLEHLKLF